MKKVLITVGIVLGLLIIGSFLLPNIVHVERSITIKAPIDVIFNQVNDLMNWEKWSPWSEKDPDMKIEYSDIPLGKDAWYTWSGNDEVKSGKLTIIESVDNRSVSTQLEFEGMGSNNKGNWKFEETSDGVKVTWGFDGDMSKPIVIGKYFGLMIDGVLGADLEKGLTNIKEFVENMEMATPSVSNMASIAFIDFEGMNVVTIRETTRKEKIGDVLAALYAELNAYVEENGGKIDGAPFAIYHKWSDEEVELEAGLPLKAIIKGTNRVVSKKRPNTRVAKVTHTGSYEGLDAVHQRINIYITETEHLRSGAPWEIYLTDPMSEPDTTKWTTEVYYPIESY